MNSDYQKLLNEKEEKCDFCHSTSGNCCEAWDAKRIEKLNNILDNDPANIIEGITEADAMLLGVL